MLLLPLIDDALRNGLEPLPHGGTIAIGAEADERFLRVTVADDGLPRNMYRSDRSGIDLLRQRLCGLCGDGAHLRLTEQSPLGVVVTIEVPLETARDHR
jgi:LytS/YehU family sensor histidine kinase